MNTIKTIDLWTEQNENHIECFSGAFVDGFENGNIPFDTDIDNCINVALSQQFNDFALNEIYKKLAIKRYDIDYKKYGNLNELIFDIESLLDEEDDEELEDICSKLSEIYYYNYVNK